MHPTGFGLIYLGGDLWPYRYSRLVEYHFKQSVLQSLPEQQQSLQEDIVFMPPMGMAV